MIVLHKQLDAVGKFIEGQPKFKRLGFDIASNKAVTLSVCKIVCRSQRSHDCEERVDLSRFLQCRRAKHSAKLYGVLAKLNFKV
jgi:hypothetical protein